MTLAADSYASGSGRQLYNPYAASSSSHFPHRSSSYDPQEHTLTKAQDILNDPSTAYLTARLPTVASLCIQLSAVQDPSYDPAGQVAWCHEVLDLVERTQHLQEPSGSLNPGRLSPGTPARLADPELQRLVDVALPMLLRLAGRKKATQHFVPGYVAEALYLCSTCEASGAFPRHIPHNPKRAFTQCEQAARAGYHPAWLELARDFERFGDAVHARDCYEHGAAHAVPGCLFRLGMAHLSGQLGLPRSPEQALPLLKQAAALSTINTPHPAYVYALLLLDELPNLSVQPHVLAPHISPGTASAHEARRHLERAAYLGHAPAQTRLGQAYELADDAGGFPFDAALSVQYYALAAGQGDAEAEMGLSKWFLCGSEGSFERDERLAFGYAESAARRGLPSAMFAMGYYKEVAIGCAKDLVAARKWYQMAAQQGNTDAPERLQALSRSKTLTRTQHEQLTETTLVRKRTQARMRSEATPRTAAPPIPLDTARPAPSNAPPMPTGPAFSDTTASSPPVAYRDHYPAAEVRPPVTPRGRPPSQQQPGFPMPHGSPRGRESSLGPSTPSSVDASPAALRGSHGVSPAPQARASGPVPQAYHRRVQSADPSPYDSHQMRGHPAARGPRSVSRPPAGSSPAPQAPPSRAPNAGASRRPMQASYRGPQTFQDMGIYSAKAEEKECIIM